jgi:hypothetical protein
MPTKRELEERVHELESHLDEAAGRAREILGYEGEDEDDQEEEDVEEDV